MSRGEHPADVWTRQQIATAVGFDVHFMKGPLDRYRETAADRTEAEAIADRLNKAHGQHGRRAIIYAILPNGTRLPLGESYLTAAARARRRNS